MAVLIGLAGRRGAGKSFAADVLVREHGLRLVKFAGPLKDMLRAIGLNDDELEGPFKEEPCERLCWRTPRWAMQTLGTEWGRHLMHEDFWGRLWESQVADLLRQGRSVVTDDVRFSNEAERIRRLGGSVIRLTAKGEGSPAADSHSSEAIDFECDGEIVNTFSAHDMRVALDAIVSQLLHESLRGSRGQSVSYVSL